MDELFNIKLTAQYADGKKREHIIISNITFERASNVVTTTMKTYNTSPDVIYADMEDKFTMVVDFKSYVSTGCFVYEIIPSNL